MIKALSKSCKEPETISAEADLSLIKTTTGIKLYCDFAVNKLFFSDLPLISLLEYFEEQTCLQSLLPLLKDHLHYFSNLR